MSKKYEKEVFNFPIDNFFICPEFNLVNILTIFFKIIFLLELFDLKIFDRKGDLKSLCNKKDYFVIIQTLTVLKLTGIKSYCITWIANFSQKLPIYMLYCTLLEYKAKLIYLGEKRCALLVLKFILYR